MLFRSDRKSTRLNSSHTIISYAVFCLKKKKIARVVTCRGRTAPFCQITQRPHRACRDMPQLHGGGAQDHQLGSLVCGLCFFFLIKRPPPKFSLPYTTLFR